jgi:hypothetical protein
MSERGRHARSAGPEFYRDLLLLGGGIILLGVIVFGGLSLWAGRSGAGPDTTTTIATTTSTAPTTTTTVTTTPETTVTTTPTTLRPERSPSEVRVIVLNSVGVTGLAATLTTQLAAEGYRTSPPANYSPELSDTMIFHAPGFALEAVTLAELVPDGTVAPNEEITGEYDVDIVVILGRSYRG